MRSLSVVLVLACLCSVNCVYRATSTADAWNNHAAAFASSNVTKILLDYTDYSQIHFHDSGGTGAVTTYTGLTEIGQFFTNIFVSLAAPNSVSASSNPFQVPVPPVVEEPSAIPGGAFGQVMLLWNGGTNKNYPHMTDSFIMSPTTFKILRQNIVQFPADADCPPTATNPTNVAITEIAGASPIQDGWNNHFTNFGGQSATGIITDYTAESVTRVYNNLRGPAALNIPVPGGSSVQPGTGTDAYTGTTEIKDFFSNLFAVIGPASNVDAPAVITQSFSNVDGNPSGSDLGTTYLIWRSSLSGIAYATDTFFYNAAGKIIRQNIVQSFSSSPCCQDTQYFSSSTCSAASTALQPTTRCAKASGCTSAVCCTSAVPAQSDDCSLSGGAQGGIATGVICAFILGIGIGVLAQAGRK